MYLQHVEPKLLPVLHQYVCRAVRPDTVEAVFVQVPYARKVAAELAKALSVALPRGQKVQNGGFGREDGVTRRLHLAGALASFHRAYQREVPLHDSLLIGYRTYEDLARHLRGTESFVRFDRFIHAALAIVRATEHRLVSCSKCDNKFVFHADPSMPRSCPFCSAIREGTFKRVKANSQQPASTQSPAQPALPGFAPREPSPLPSFQVPLAAYVMQAGPLTPSAYQPQQFPWGGGQPLLHLSP